MRDKAIFAPARQAGAVRMLSGLPRFDLTTTGAPAAETACFRPHPRLGGGASLTGRFDNAHNHRPQDTCRP